MNVTQIDLLVIAIFLGLSEYLFTKFLGYGMELGHVCFFLGTYSFMHILRYIIKGE